MDILDQLKKAGLPPPLMKDALQGVSDRFPEKLTKLTELLSTAEGGDYKVILVFGNDSPFKDKFCAAFMKWYMVAKNKTGRWITNILPDDQMIGMAGITVVLSTHLLSPIAVRMLASAIREKVPLNRTFVLCATSKDEFDKVFGEETMTFISHISVAVDVSVARASIMEI